MKNLEIEVKARPGGFAAWPDNAKSQWLGLLDSITREPNTSDWERVPTIGHLNHYYEVLDGLGSLIGAIKAGRIRVENPAALDSLDLSRPAHIRTREIWAFEDLGLSTQTELIFKQGDDPENGVERTEITLFCKNRINEVDNMLQVVGMIIKSKWARIRHSFNSTAEVVIHHKDDYDKVVTGTTCLSLDFNAGYGPMVELEWVQVSDISADWDEVDVREAIQAYLLETLHTMGLEPLQAEVLNSMYKHYTSDWKRFYDYRPNINFPPFAFQVMKTFTKEDWDIIVPLEYRAPKTFAPSLTEAAESIPEPLTGEYPNPLAKDNLPAEPKSSKKTK